MTVLFRTNGHNGDHHLDKGLDMKPTNESAVSRRAALGLGAAGAAMVVVGCADSSETTSPSSTTASSGSASASTQGAKALVATDDVPVGGGVILADEQIVVTQPSEEVFVAMSSLCPHQGCPVSSISDGVITCPCHDSQFDLDGTVRQGPATEGLESREITVESGEIFLG